MLLHDRYELVDEIGRGGFGTTHLARDTHASGTVAVKELSLRGQSDWKPIEHFEREAKVLRALDHRGVPQFEDAFTVQEPDEMTSPSPHSKVPWLEAQPSASRQSLKLRYTSVLHS